MQQRYGYDSKSYFAIQRAVREFFTKLSESGIYAKITAEDILECEKKVRALELVKNRLQSNDGVAAKDKPTDTASIL
jgi:hypothetical protein